MAVIRALVKGSALCHVSKLKAIFPFLLGCSNENNLQYRGKSYCSIIYSRQVVKGARINNIFQSHFGINYSKAFGLSSFLFPIVSDCKLSVCKCYL